MKTKSLILSLVALIAFAGNAWAQKDITSQYITNAKLTQSFNVGWTTTNFNGDHTQGNNTEGYAVESYAGWGSVERPSYSMLQNITLPAGHYRLVNYAFYRWGNAYNTDASKSEAYLKAGSDQVKIATLGSITGQAAYANSMAEAANRFETKMYRNVVEFTIASDNTTIEIGVYGTHSEAKSWFICGMFELFDLDDVASVSSPTDATFEITNPGFEYLNTTGWTINGFNYIDNNDNIGGKSGAAYVEYYRWGGLENNHYISQTLTGLENGLYEVTVYGHQQQGTPNDGVKLYANNDYTFIGSTTQDYSVRTTVTTNELTIKIQTEGSTANWTAFDKFRLKFFGDPLQAYKDLLAEKVAEAQALVNGGTLRTGAANQLQTIINNNDNDDDAFTTESEFNTAVSNIEAGITQANAIADTYAEFDAYKTLIDNLAAGAASSSALTTFQNAVNTANTAVTNATSTSVVPTQIANLRSAGLTYISDSNVTGTFDITFLASTAIGDWKNYYGNPAGTLADAFLTNRPSTVPQFPEFYVSQCDLTGKQLYQTVEDLPAGYYQVGMYAGAMFTPDRGFDTAATEGDADRTFAFAGDEADETSIVRTGMPIKFATVMNFPDLTILDVNVHLQGSGLTNDLTFGITKDQNGSNWQFAQIASIVYSRTPDLTQLEATRDQLVAEAQGILNSSSQYLTTAQQQALQAAITAGNDANTFESLNTVTLTTLPNAINTARQQITQAQASIPVMHQALERFEQYYNLVDGTDYQRVTMSAKAWTDLLAKVNVATLALDDISQAAQYATIAADLNAQMDATDVSIRLFKSYKAMVKGLQSLSIAAGTTYAANTYMDTDATEQTAIEAMNDAFVTYREAQSVDVNMAGFLGENLDFSEAEGSALINTDAQKVYDLPGWEETYENLENNGWAFIRTADSNNSGKLYLRTNWQSTAGAKLAVSKLKALPEGDYQLTLSWNSDLANMTNDSKFTFDGTDTTVGENTSAATMLTYDFTISESAKDFDLVLGFTSTGTGNAAAQIIADDITLICLAGTPFQRAYDATEAVADNTAAKAAAKSAVTEYATYDGNESGLLENGERGDAYWEAVYVLRNAKTIADNDGDATSLVANADLMNTTKDGNFPAGWTGTYEGDNPDGNAWIGTQDGEQVFNIWAANITLIDMMQTINNLPKGAYRLSMDMGTNNLPENGDGAPIFNFINPGNNQKIGASELVITDNTGEHRNFDTYTSAAEENVDHQLTIGVRSEGHYFQMKSIKLEFIGDAATAAAETDASFVRQDFFWQNKDANNVEFFFDGGDYANAWNVKIYPTGVNRIIHGLTGQFATSVPNVDANGVITITDGYPLTNTKAFTATNATYSRNMSRTWGTLILPYPLTSDENVQYYTFKKISTDADENQYMGFEPAESVAANTPVVFKKLSSEATSVTLAGSGDFAVTTAAQGTASVDNDDWTMEGVYASTELTDEQIDGTVYYIAQDQFWKANTEVGLTIPAFRSYFHGPAGEGAAKFRIKILDGEATSIVDLTNGVELRGNVYTLGGQLVRKNATSLEGLHGTYIIGGKKVFIK
ncbi:MAG: hypothetical protein Q4E32_03500 [Bacteroidales bacterium]|nr:hypothetical protein [Bacteroidales bacterium]